MTATGLDTIMDLAPSVVRPRSIGAFCLHGHTLPDGARTRMTGLLGERRWRVPIVLLSACVGLPPLYAVTLAVPATKMSVILFGGAVPLSG